MNKSLEKTLQGLSQEQLYEIVVQLHDLNKDVAKEVTRFVAAYDPKQLVKLINTQIASLKRGGRFVYRYADILKIESQIAKINQDIETLLNQKAAQHALECCLKLIETDIAVFDRVDDSGGDIRYEYYKSFELLNRCFLESKASPDFVADYILNAVLHDKSDIRAHFLDFAMGSLKAGAVTALEEKINNLEKADDGLLIYIKKAIADAKQDSDAYIKAVTEQFQGYGREIDAKDIVEIVQRLIRDFRGEQAIKWLDRIDLEVDDYRFVGEQFAKKITLLYVEAYKLEGYDSKAQQKLWLDFTRSLSVDLYQRYIKHADAQQIEQAQQYVKEVCEKQEDRNRAMYFLSGIGQFELLDAYIQRHYDKLDCVFYSHIRKLSTTMATNGYPLSATLLRRVLIEDVLRQGQSTYYKYSVSDVKKMLEFSLSINDWQNFDDNDSFINKLYAQYKRKHSFWFQLKEAGLVGVG